VADDWHELMIPQRTMRSSIARVNEQFDPRFAANNNVKLWDDYWSIYITLHYITDFLTWPKLKKLLGPQIKALVTTKAQKVRLFEQKCFQLTAELWQCVGRDNVRW